MVAGSMRAARTTGGIAASEAAAISTATGTASMVGSLPLTWNSSVSTYRREAIPKATPATAPAASVVELRESLVSGAAERIKC